MADQGQIPIVANWKAFNDNAPCLGIQEFPLFTDARLTGEIEVGPYKFINTIAGGNRNAVNPGVILRYAIHKEWDHPTFEKTDDALYHGGTAPEELAALSSLILGIRLRAGRSVRRFEPGRDPLGTPEEIGDQTSAYFFNPRSYNIPNAAKGEHPLGEVALLRSLLGMLPSNVVSLVRSARMYQDALWLSESQPEFSWLLLVSAVESAANAWRKNRGDNVDRLAISKPELHQFLSAHSDETLVRIVSDAFADSMGLTKKFIDFCLQFNAGPPAVRPPEWARYAWGDLSRHKKAMGRIYQYRSRALHDGVPFPAPMCNPPYSQPNWPVPAERMFALGTHQRGSTWVASDLPMDLHLFEYIARTAILGWWKSLLEPHYSMEEGIVPPEKVKQYPPEDNGVPRPTDETYIIDLCDEILKQKASRGHKFEFLRGDTGKRGKGVQLPVDAYYQDLNLVVEYCERQHTEAVPFFDRKIVPSGITRGEQRKLYDQRRRDVLPKHNITLIEISYQEFEHDARKRLRRVPSDLAVIDRRLGRFVKTAVLSKQL